MATLFILFYGLFLELILKKKRIIPVVIFSLWAGEEASWGQHLYSFQTPEFLVDLNSQNELNVHNLMFLGNEVGVYIYVLYACCLIDLYLFQSRIGTISKEHCKILIAVYIFVLVFQDIGPSYYIELADKFSNPLEEIFELHLSGVLVITLARSKNKLLSIRLKEGPKLHETK